MTFCLLVCQMCGKGTFLQIRSQIVIFAMWGLFFIRVHFNCMKRCLKYSQPTGILYKCLF